MNRHIEHFPDKWYTVVADVYEYRVEFKVYNISGQVVADDNVTEELVYGDDYVPLDQASACIEGQVKWDRCSDWDTGNVHFCSRQMIDDLNQVLLWCWDFASKNIKGFDV